MDKLLIANHKNYMSVNNLITYINDVNNFIEDENVVVCPSNIYTPYFLKHKYKVGLQNIAQDNTTCTGEITSRQARNMGISYVIIGHSERRLLMNETTEQIKKKVMSSLHDGLKVVLCVGETKEERKKNKTKKIIEKQILDVLKDIKDLSNVIIAYEPIWAIGSGETPLENEIKEVVDYIKQIVNKHCAFDNIKVLYGGSVSAKNIEELNKISELSGFLIGKASTDAKELLYMIEVVSN